MIKKKIKLGSREYQQNVAKQKFLNKQGIKVKIDGSWGPWQQKQYDRLTSNNNDSKQDWFVRAMVGASMAENPAVMTASGWKQDKNGNWKQERTPESDQLADNLAELSWTSPTHPGTAIIGKATGKAIKYGRNVYNRYKFANTSLAPVGKVSRVLQRHLPLKSRSTGYRAELGFQNEDVDINGIVTRTGGVLTKPGITTELHFNPNITYDPSTSEILSATPRTSSRIVGMRVIKNLPSKTVIASDGRARAIPQILKDQPLKDRVLYYLTGRSPKLPTTSVDGYSTDIIEMLTNASKKGNGIVTPSLTTRMKGTNTFGKSYNKYSKYFSTNNNGFVEFSDMTPEQVEAWNTEVAPNLGVHIDPETRLADHLMYITK